MKTLLISIATFFTFSSFAPQSEKCIKPEEMKLYELLMAYRKSKNLPQIPLSHSLTHVAKLHAFDLDKNQPVKGKCNMHSWSDKGPWKACCYTSDHKQAACMWNKPKELTKYTGSGFEISAWVPEVATAQNAMNGWKKSHGHNQVMINQGSWKNMDWKAVGVGISGAYAVIWFGTLEDPDQTKVMVCPKEEDPF